MSTDKKDDVIDQIRRIMRLANRAGTEGEKNAADAAMLRLANKHGIDLDDIKATDADVRTEAFLDGEWHTYPVMELGYISAVLRQHFGIVLIQHKSGKRVRFEWVGTRMNVDIARHVTIVLLRAVQKDWREARILKKSAEYIMNRPGYQDPAKQRMLVQLSSVKKRAFMDGWFWTIHQKLKEHPLRNDREQFEEEKRAAEEMLEKMKEQRRIEESRNDGKKMDEEDRRAVMLGYKAAKKMNLSRPCEGGSTSPLAIGVSQ